MDIFNYKCINKKNKKSNINIDYTNYIKNLMYRTLITIILCLICSILIKSSDTYKEKIYKNVYRQNMSFTSFKKFYDKYLGGVLPINDVIKETQPVFNDDLTYTEQSKYLDGVKLKVTDKYLVPVLKSGIVVFIGEKESYGNTIIIQGMDGIDIWYSNIENTNVSLYDYVEEKTLLANTIKDELCLSFSQDGVFLNYEEYLEKI